MKKLYSFLVMFLFVGSLLGQQLIVRGLELEKSTKKDFVKVFPKVVLDDPDFFVSNCMVGTHKALAMGMTNNAGKLESFIYKIKDKHTNRNKYIDDYDNLQKKLKQKYGEPVFDKMTWDNDLYENDASNYGFAIALGHLSYLTLWNVDRGTIGISLSGDNYEISIGISYMLYEEHRDEETTSNDL